MEKIDTYGKRVEKKRRKGRRSKGHLLVIILKTTLTAGLGGFVTLIEFHFHRGVKSKVIAKLKL